MISGEKMDVTLLKMKDEFKNFVVLTCTKEEAYKFHQVNTYTYYL